MGCPCPACARARVFLDSDPLLRAVKKGRRWCKNRKSVWQCARAPRTAHGKVIALLTKQTVRRLSIDRLQSPQPFSARRVLGCGKSETPSDRESPMTHDPSVKVRGGQILESATPVAIFPRRWVNRRFPKHIPFHAPE